MPKSMLEADSAHSPLLYLSGSAHALLFRPRHHASHVPFHALFVEAIQLQALGGGRTRGPGAGNFLDSVEGVYEDTVWKREGSAL